MKSLLPSSSELLERWRRQLGPRRRLLRPPRPLAAIGWLTTFQQPRGLIDVRKLTWLVVRDDVDAHYEPIIRCLGFATQPVPGGIQIGGRAQNVLEKHLQLPPGVGGRGWRFDLANPRLLEQALALEHWIERHHRHLHAPRRSRPRFPPLWAAFDPRTAMRLGLALETCRFHCGDALYPLSTVTAHWRAFRTVYADLRCGPRRQVVPLDAELSALVGHGAGWTYDLRPSRFEKTVSTTVGR